ncbi:hypothetical protein SmJEL517_g02451 [Synchytrium microbalum]|uniref:Uncharacterized protein n=1 Tax=Synchytrium microbalum TaxID=1806994 RepID=A0A507CC37_9FUNG|nr:uncharacterized protein SmJEL517_g02451 [Synchytrium microbalum]TPX35113.1 hypothetical protein SmJEL517_g02451 [Synchytrium microbalum]
MAVEDNTFEAFEAFAADLDDSLFEETRVRVLTYDKHYEAQPTDDDRYLMQPEEIKNLKEYVAKHFAMKFGPSGLTNVVNRYYALGDYEFVEALCSEIIRQAATYSPEDARQSGFGVDEVLETAARSYISLGRKDWENRSWWKPFLAYKSPGVTLLKGRIHRSRMCYEESLREFKLHLDERPKDYKARIECAKTLFESEPCLASWSLRVFLRANEARIYRPAVLKSESFAAQYRKAELVDIQAFERQLRDACGGVDDKQPLDPLFLRKVYSEDIATWVEMVLIRHDNPDDEEADQTVRDL